MSDLKYGLNVEGKIRVFRKDKEVQGKNKKKYQITDVWFNVSEKQEDDSYINKSMNLFFGKDMDKPENNTNILIKDAFFILSGSGDYTRIALFVKDYEVVE